MSEKQRERPTRSKYIPPVTPKSELETPMEDQTLDLMDFPRFPVEEETPMGDFPSETNVIVAESVISQEFPPFPDTQELNTIESDESTESSPPEMKESPILVEMITHPIVTDETSEVYSQPIESPSTVVNAEYDQLKPLEKEILEIAESILKKKKFVATIKVERVEMMSPLVEELYSKCIAKLTHTKGYPKEEIFQTIQNLEHNLWIVTDQRRTKEEIINNPILTRILDFIYTHPGTHARDPAIETEIGISRNPFIKHITILEAFGLIRSKKIGRTENYFVSGTPEDFDELKVLFENPLIPQIIQFLLEEPSLSLSELARRLDVYHGAIQYHLKTLTEMQILLKSEDEFTLNKDLLRKYNNLYKIPPFNC